MSDIKVECCKRKCKHVHTVSERKSVPSPDFEGINVLVCPKCGNDEYYRLDKPAE